MNLGDKLLLIGRIYRASMGEDAESLSVAYAKTRRYVTPPADKPWVATCEHTHAYGATPDEAVDALLVAARKEAMEGLRVAAEEWRKRLKEAEVTLAEVEQM